MFDQLNGSIAGQLHPYVINAQQSNFIVLRTFVDNLITNSQHSLYLVDL